MKIWDSVYISMFTFWKFFLCLQLIFVKGVSSIYKLLKEKWIIIFLFFVLMFFLTKQMIKQSPSKSWIVWYFSFSFICIYLGPFIFIMKKKKKLHFGKFWKFFWKNFPGPFWSGFGSLCSSCSCRQFGTKFDSSSWIQYFVAN